MIKTGNINKYGLIMTPDTFRPSVFETNKDDTTGVNIHFGINMDIIVVVAKNKQLSKDNQERIRILTEAR